MANGFTVQQVGQELIPYGKQDWLFNFEVVYGTPPQAIIWSFPIEVAASVPNEDRTEQAKIQLKAFVAALSAEVRAW